MPPHELDRRRVLTYGAATAVGIWAGFGASAAAATGRQPDKPGTPLKFSVTIPGLSEASKSVRALVVDEFRVDPPNPTGRDNDYWNIKPGAADFGTATFTLAGSPSVFKELKAWFAETAAGGKNIRKNILVNLRNPDSGAERTYSLNECFPTQWSSVNFDTSSTVQTETLTVKVGRIEFKT